MRPNLTATLLALIATGCAAQKPPTMTPLERASRQWVDAYWSARDEANRLHIQGLEPCDASLTIALTATRDGQLGISAKPAQVPVGITAMISGTKQAANTATMDFKSDACAKAMGRQMQTGTAK